MADVLNNQLVFELVTPSALTISEEVEMVVIPGADGDFGVLAGHTPVLTTVRPGIIDMYIDGKIAKSFFVESGFAEANLGECTVLAESATPLDDISIDAADERLKVARENFNSSEGLKEEKEVIVAEALVQALSRNATKH